jgi:teichuronic acid exporter
VADTLKERIYSGTIWVTAGRVGYYAVAFATNIVLARLLTPEDFGKVAIALFFVSLAGVIAESGFGGALIRNNSATDLDFSTAFMVNFGVSVFFAVMGVLASGFISRLYGEPDLQWILIVLSVFQLINAFHLIQVNSLTRNMRFREKVIYDLLSVSLSSMISVSMAVGGAGIWALVLLQPMTIAMTTGLLWIFERRIPLFRFSLESFRSHYKFGLNTTLTTLLSSMSASANQVVMGKYFSISLAGLYYQASKLQEAPVGIVNSVYQNVIYSGLSKIQDDKSVFSRSYNELVRLFTCFIGCICMVFVVFPVEIMVFLFGTAWADAGYFLRVLALANFFLMQEIFVRNVFKIYDQTAVIRNMEFLKTTVNTLGLVMGVILQRFEVVVLGYLGACVASAMANLYVVGRVNPSLRLVQSAVIYKVCSLIATVYALVLVIRPPEATELEVVALGIMATAAYVAGLIAFGLLTVRDLKELAALGAQLGARFR